MSVRTHTRAAVIDIGSNTIHVLVADCDRGRIWPVYADRVRARLGLWVADETPLGAERIAAVASIVRRFAGEARHYGARDIIVFGTHAVRVAPDRLPLIAAIEQEAGVAVRVLSPAEEVELCVAGAGLGPVPRAPFVCADVGGGSCDVAAVGQLGVAATASIAVGSGVMAERDLAGDPPARAEVDRVVEKLRRMLSGLELGAPEFPELVATGGAVRRLRRQFGADRRAPLPAATLRETVGRLLRTPSAAWPRKVTPDRAALIRAGGLIVQEIVARWRVSLWRVSHYGLREGALALRARDMSVGAAPLRGTEERGGHRDP
jgi:exopolyphosphatase/guanosine-5'-triphosphate,3'-diphosphate pyrophosphatase